MRDELVGAGFTFVDRLPTLEASVPITTVEQLQTWQSYYQLLKVLVWLGPLLVIVFAVAGAWLLRDVAVAGLWFTGTALLALVGAVVALRVVIANGTDRLADPVAADAARAVVATFGDTLVRNAMVVGILLIIGLAVAAYVAASPAPDAPVGPGRAGGHGLTRAAQARVASAGSCGTFSALGSSSSRTTMSA